MKILNNFILMLEGISILFLYSCKQNTSDISQMTIKADCTIDKKQALHYYEKYGKNNPKITLNSLEAFQAIWRDYGYYGKIRIEDREELSEEEKKQVEQEKKETEEAIKQAFEILSNVPEKYLEYALGTSEGSYNIPINLVNYSVRGSFVGVTMLMSKEVNANVTQYDYYSRPQTITKKVEIPYPHTIQYTHLRTLAHEFGHAVEGYVQQQEKNLTNLKFKKDLETLSKEILQTRNKDLISPYLRSNTNPVSRGTRTSSSQEAETFAELFDTWYCSQNARNILKAGIKNAYNFAVKYLEKPMDFKEENTTDITYPEDKQTSTQIANLIKNKKIPSTCTYNKNNIVYILEDESTKRVWINQGGAIRNWKEAYNYCNNLKIKKLSYRLPTVEELVAFSSTTCMDGSNRLVWTSSVPSSNPSSDTSIASTAYAVYRNDSYYKTITVNKYDKRSEIAFLCVSETTNN